MCGGRVHLGVGGCQLQVLVVDGGVVVGAGGVDDVVISRPPGVWAFMVLKVAINVACM